MRLVVGLIAAAALAVLAPQALRATTSKPASTWALKQIVAKRFAPAGAGAVRRAFCIVGRESSWNPRAISSTGDYGLFQINWSAHHRSYDWTRILDPVYNTAVAWRLSNHGTHWQPWAGGRWAC